jgi:hypothetical protein
MIAGFASGMLEGSLRQSMMAALAISKGVSGLGAGLFAARFFRENWIVPLLTGALLTLANEIVFLFLSGGGAWANAGRIIVGRVLYHAFLTPLAFWIVVRARDALLGPRLEVS